MAKEVSINDLFTDMTLWNISISSWTNKVDEKDEEDDMKGEWYKFANPIHLRRINAVSAAAKRYLYSKGSEFRFGKGGLCLVHNSLNGEILAQLREFQDELAGRVQEYIDTNYDEDLAKAAETVPEEVMRKAPNKEQLKYKFGLSFMPLVLKAPETSNGNVGVEDLFLEGLAAPIGDVDEQLRSQAQAYLEGAVTALDPETKRMHSTHFKKMQEWSNTLRYKNILGNQDLNALGLKFIRFCTQYDTDTLSEKGAEHPLRSDGDFQTLALAQAKTLLNECRALEKPSRRIIL